MRYLYLLGFLASFLMVACSDPVKADPDSSSSFSSSSSSIAEITSSSSDDSVEGKSSSSIANTPNPRSSSSSIINNPSQSKSSSSVVTLQSSSSLTSNPNQTNSSSSQAKSSSSSAKSSSSVASSSSRAKSSSFKTQDDIPFGGINIIYDSIVDPRDGHKYLYSTYTANNGYGTILTISIMTQNLNFAEKITLGAEEQDDDTKVEKYCYDDIPQNCDFYGGLYQWAEMMALPYECNTISCAHLIQEQHQGICPDGWHLITNKEMRAVINSTNEGVQGVKARSTWAIGGGRNTSGFTLLGAGGRNTNKTFIDLNRVVYWFFPTEFDENIQAASQGYISGNENNFGIDNVYNYKAFGSSARCVMDY